ncbi:MAG: ribose-5-phosphate isomerase RpiA [Ignisphaera sp.]|nr:ribose-5-phosphate isomerase RpiA [Ignisphaera sp.]MCX8167661.1 ribose-5-phosphate isomerase RpiA [Ignisphaera sp.]MDW8085651.1 ribose-5-phosphate isomerase RpiA [Ignisphaera sp.]
MGASDTELAKLRAAKKAFDIVANLKPAIIGVGTGSTVDRFVELIPASSDADVFSNAIFVCASLYTMYRIKELGYTVAIPSTIDRIDVYVDGADEVDGELNMVKGGGGASTLEKVLTYASLKRIYIVDYTKLVPRLCYRHPIPIEVLPEALSIVYRKLTELNLNPVIRRGCGGKHGFVVSDTRGVIVDIKPTNVTDFRKLERTLKMIPGVVEVGLFIDLADTVIVGYPDRVEILHKSPSNTVYEPFKYY